VLDRFSRIVLGDKFPYTQLQEYRIAQYLVLSISSLSLGLLAFALLVLLPSGQNYANVKRFPNRYILLSPLR